MRRRSAGRIAGASVSLAVVACLDGNPKFQEPTGTTSGASDSASAGTTDPGTPSTQTATSDAPTTTGSPTTNPPTTDTETTDTSASTATSGVSSSSTTSQPVCGDGSVEGDEECDNGMGNADDADCTSECKNWVCGDGKVHAVEEHCEDGNGAPDDGCVACKVPRTCKQVRDLDVNAPSGQYVVDPDGPGGNAAIPVACDMDLLGGGWTVIERSPNSDPIGRALFVDAPWDIGNPLASRFRLPKMVMIQLLGQSLDMYVGCGGGDRLIADKDHLFDGEMNGLSCSNYGKVTYKEAALKGYVRNNVELCTGFTGLNDGECPGAWRIDEWEQMICGLPEFPWSGIDMPITPQGADAFAVDPQVIDGPPPEHDCHVAGASRTIMLR